MPTFQDNNSIEGFGLSYIEAAKYGVPSIMSNTGGASEAVINNKTGWFVLMLVIKKILLIQLLSL